MSRIDELIAKLCPDGVEFRGLGEVLRIRNGKDHKPLESGDIPVYGSGGIMRYVDAAAAEGPSVLIPRKGSLGNIFYVEGPFWVVDTIFRTEIDSSQVEPKFVYHQLLTMKLGEMNQAGGVPSQTQTVLNSLRIPVPPLEVQREIVRTLDQFTQLEAELEAELEARRRQYEHYRDDILCFDESVPQLALDAVVEKLRTGLNPRQNFKLNAPGASNLYITVRELAGFTIRPTEKTDRVDSAGLARIQARAQLQVDDVLFSGTGTIGRTALVVEEPRDWNIKEGVYALTPNKEAILPRFLIHLLRSGKTRSRILASADGSTVASVSMASLRRVLLPVPSLEKQRRCVALLDNFENLTNDLSIGLPAELAARRKQYEHYRDRLLTFEEAF